VVEVQNGRNLVVNSLDRTRESQIFFLDPKSHTIKSVQDKESSIDIQRAGASSNLQLWTTSARWFQLFKYENGNLCNIKNLKCFDISGGKDVEGQNLIVYKKHNGLNQQWDLTYIDEMKPELQKGEFNAEFGFYVGKEFSIITKMAGSRRIDIVNDQLVIKTRSSSTTQRWYFDQSSRTIKSASSNKSWDIRGSGKQNILQVWNTSSRWW